MLLEYIFIFSNFYYDDYSFVYSAPNIWLLLLVIVIFGFILRNSSLSWWKVNNIYALTFENALEFLVCFVFTCIQK